MKDLTVILLASHWSADHLERSLGSVARLMLDSGLSVQCLLVETLAAGTDVSRLRDASLPPMPQIVRQYLERDGFDYLVEYGATARALRRMVRCAQGRYVCVLREGDEMGYRLTADKRLDEDFDLLVGVTIASADSLAAHGAMAANPFGSRALPAIVGMMTGYDGALLARRDFLDDVLGRVGYDAVADYPAYLNEVLAIALLRDSGKVGLTEQIAVFPLASHIVRHRDRIIGYTMPCMSVRRAEAAGAFELGTEAIIDAVIGRIVERLFGGQSAIKPARNPASDGRDAFLDGSISVGVDRAVQWLCRQVARAWDLDTTGAWRTLPTPDATAMARAEPEVSLVVSAFRGEKLIYSFLADLARQTAFDQAELILVLPQPNLVQDLVCECLALSVANVQTVPLDHDPGIYECWNTAIRMARGRFISNANIDDRRDRSHLKRLIELLRSSGADVASAAVSITREFADIGSFDGDIGAHVAGDSREVWFGGSAGGMVHKSLRDFFVFNASGEVEQCMNFPHCMPVWRRSLHDRFGFFDERQYGTYADFAFWLNAAAQGASFVHLESPLGLYYLDPRSHNRRHSSEEKWVHIVRGHLPAGVAIRAPVHVAPPRLDLLAQVSARTADEFPRLDFGNQLAQNYGRHRSGWSYALTAFDGLHDPHASVYCNTFIEKRFVWGSDPGDGGCGPAAPHLRPWIGFVHVPPHVPSWFQFEQSNRQIFSKGAWRRSMPHCKGLFALSEHHRRHMLEALRPDFPVSVLYHPTEFPDLAFDFDRYLANPTKRLIQIGWWLRKLNAIQRLQLDTAIPTLLGRSDWSKDLLTYAERRYYGLGEPTSVDAIDFLENDAYDRLLAENLVFVDFYDTSANNAVIECIARGTPIVVCRHPAVEEYLGPDYPLFYDTYQEINAMLLDAGRIRAACDYMLGSHVRRRLTLEHFKSSFAASEVVRHACS